MRRHRLNLKQARQPPSCLRVASITSWIMGTDILNTGLFDIPGLAHADPTIDRDPSGLGDIPTEGDYNWNDIYKMASKGGARSKVANTLLGASGSLGGNNGGANS